MADRDRKVRGPSGTAGGTDVEPLRGGMREEERREAGPERGSRRDPPAPYHDSALPEGGLAPRAMPGEGAPDDLSSGAGGASPAERTANESVHETAAKKIPQERTNFEREGANAPRTDPGARGAGEDDSGAE